MTRRAVASGSRILASSLYPVCGNATCSSVIYRRLSARRRHGSMATQAATAHRVHIVPDNTGLYKVKQTDEAARKASQLLQEDLEEHHVFFNEKAFHNHITHHILALYGTGAAAAALQTGFDNNSKYQRPTVPAHEDAVADLVENGWATAAERYLGREAHYHDFLRFFQHEIDAKGWQAVVASYVFAGTAAADDMLARLFAGALHPLIQLMYGVEWAQPAIVAEALAQAAVHSTLLKDFLVTAEKAAAAELRRPDEGGEAQSPSLSPSPSMATLYEAVAADDRLSMAVKVADRMQDGDVGLEAVLGRAWEELIQVTSRVSVSPTEIDEKTVDMFNSIFYVAASAAARPRNPRKHPKFDFFLMHHCNLSPIFLTINAQPWISQEAKSRILEWKMRLDLLEYAARACTQIGLDQLASYKPKRPDAKAPMDVISRLHDFPDDGHAIKLGRAALICQQVSKQYEDKDWMKIKGDDLWMKVHHLIADSVEAPGPNWVFTAGLAGSWDVFPDMEESKL